jgi:hypothetical protein
MEARRKGGKIEVDHDDAHHKYLYFPRLVSKLQNPYDSMHIFTVIIMVMMW